MRIKILKPIATVYGGFGPGKVVDIPEVVARKWCRAGIAKESNEEASVVVKEGTQVAIQVAGVETKEPKMRPAVIPSGMFWCIYCQALHRANSKIGRSHLKHSG